ncbi:MAG: DNA circularization N-terminal domain-containing protein [Gallionellaceae bacterium]|jgi:prophage DNA circulation protein
MAWEKTLLEAKFAGLIFDIVKTDDEFTWAVVEHSYPYVNGSSVEGMGRDARRIPVEAVFYGEDYEVFLNEFLKRLDSGAAEFIHPVFGSIAKATAVRGSVHHDADNPDYASVSVEFIEYTPGNPFFDKAQASKNLNTMAAASTVCREAAVSKYATLLEKLRNANPLSGLKKLREAITGPLLAAMEFSNAVLASLDVLAYPRSWANDFSALINGALDIKDWGANVLSEWSSIQAKFSLLDIFAAPSSGAQPEAVNTSSATAPSEAQAIAVTQATVAVFIATALADAVTLAFTSIEDAQNISSSIPTETTEIKPAEIEAMANTARAAIEAAIEHCRSVYALEDSRAITEPLKDLALAIQDTAAALIETRPPLVQRIVTAPTNMRLLAHHLYGDHTRAPELWRLNGARSPFVETGETVHAFAK